MDFEGRNPIDSDFHGIRQLLQQLFLKAHVNLSELADLVIGKNLPQKCFLPDFIFLGQNYVGSVVIQSEVDDEEEDGDDEMYDSNMVFGITTAINITSRKDTSCVQQIRTYIIEKAEKNATDAALTYLRDVLGDDGRPVGFIVNERFINIPAQISVPLLDSLQKEIKRANDKKMPYNFAYFLLLVKFYRKEARKNREAEDIYSNPEEEVICKEAVASFGYSVQEEADTGMTGDWLEKDSKTSCDL